MRPTISIEVYCQIPTNFSSLGDKDGDDMRASVAIVAKHVGRLII